LGSTFSSYISRTFLQRCACWD